MSVDALGGEPGVYSKRWSGREDLERTALDNANNAKLVARMQDALRENPDGYTDRARYISVAAFKDAAGEVLQRGEIEGRVVLGPRGTGGFGYDPHFEVPELGGTYAEFSVENKAALSHRARAFRALLAALRAQGRV
jgi:XTP/dITP diphosphohydrolase